MKRLTFLLSGILCLSILISCSKEQIQPTDETNKKTILADRLELRSLASVYVATKGLRGIAEQASDCPSGMSSCLVGDFMHSMESLEEGMRYLQETDPTMVLGKLTNNGDCSITLEMIATGEEYPHNETEADILIVDDGGIQLPDDIAGALGFTSVIIPAGVYPIEDKTSSAFWSGLCIIVDVEDHS